MPKSVSGATTRFHYQTSREKRERAQPKTPGLHEQRFTLPDTFDKLTRTDVTKALPWQKSPERGFDEVLKAGQFDKVLKDRNTEDYDNTKKDLIFMPR